MTSRRLVAIMFTDIAGYTALMWADEEEIFRMLRKNRHIHKRLIKKYGAELIKAMGDGLLISFDLPSDAVRCARSIHRDVMQQGIPLKTGIHEREMARFRVRAGSRYDRPDKSL